MAGKRDAQRENAIDSMCQVAIQAIGRGGYTAMTLAEVGELAGYSRGLATHHFGSKAGLLTAILDRILARNKVEFRNATNKKQGLIRLAAVIASTLDRCIDTPDEARAYLMLALEPAAKWAAVRVREQTAALRKEAEQAAQEALTLGELSPGLTARILRASRYRWRVDTHTSGRRIRPRIWSPRAAVSATTSLL